ncbi:hypothetical protein HYALB_00004248 [Hymenoscyphus albidus]|uniref:Uncharacterized protein n=1 Tax=Hymenoscyphus albidus TaxID=595503 RepID=A0A9N9LMG4_9HELO|nr:hypothetical protein HYALB_00004248 [Hymenoscyphus albidus]
MEQTGKTPNSKPSYQHEKAAYEIRDTMTIRSNKSSQSNLVPEAFPRIFAYQVRSKKYTIVSHQFINSQPKSAHQPSAMKIQENKTPFPSYLIS